MKRVLLTTALAALVAAGPAFAQAPKDESQAPDAAQQQTDKAPDAQAAGAIEFISAQKESDWLASSLMGRPVQNGEGKSLGDINDVVLDQNGDVVAVLIGVGGFLGIGGKDVAVTYDALEFKKREASQGAGQDARDELVRRNTSPPAGSGSPLVQQGQGTSADAERKDADHSDKVIVLNASQEQLESAPAFRRLGQAETQQQSGSAPAEKQDRMSTDKQPQ